MRAILLLIIVLLQSSFKPIGEENKFRQDVAVIHNSEQGLPKGAIDKMKIYNNAPLAIASEDTYQWNGNEWAKSSSTYNEQSVSHFKNLPMNSGKVLSQVSYAGRTYIGCENGLFIKVKNKKWEQILPADENYSWALKNVSALVIDSNGNLWVKIPMEHGSCLQAKKVCLITSLLVLLPDQMVKCGSVQKMVP